ncbi:GNAT family N-acetyltransferase [Palleronia pelagia]|uniref:Putative acetyltransferase n=1 Tax=Palleronia pelagia TaxID=387096 RepID=A0A1H8DPN6_9RHOB|nr:GNAT family N-acetyltransferase [Palleronia pelagia]SEN09242.1 putative acetyltransferase [Palleronia pelagia]
MLTIEKSHPRQPDAAALLDASQAMMRKLFSPEQNHFLSHDALAAPHVTLWRARDGDAALGVVALADMGDYGEVKSLFVTDAGRRRGVARALMRAAEDLSRDRAHTHLRLETGTGLDAAVALYRSLGFTMCGPFGAYGQDGSDISASIFMEKPLEP